MTSCAADSAIVHSSSHDVSARRRSCEASVRGLLRPADVAPRGADIAPRTASASIKVRRRGRGRPSASGRRRARARFPAAPIRAAGSQEPSRRAPPRGATRRQDEAGSRRHRFAGSHRGRDHSAVPPAAARQRVGEQPGPREPRRSPGPHRRPPAPPPATTRTRLPSSCSRPGGSRRTRRLRTTSVTGRTTRCQELRPPGPPEASPGLRAAVRRTRG